MVSSLRRAHLLTLTLVLVFFPLHIYMESVVCLCSVPWGVSVPLFQRDIKQGQRGTWWLEHDRDGYFLSSYNVASLGSHFSRFLLMESFIIRQKKENWPRCHHFFFFGQMLPNVFTVCSFKWCWRCLASVFTKNTSFLTHHGLFLHIWEKFLANSILVWSSRGFSALLSGTLIVVFKWVELVTHCFLTGTGIQTRNPLVTVFLLCSYLEHLELKRLQVWNQQLFLLYIEAAAEEVSDAELYHLNSWPQEWGRQHEDIWASWLSQDYTHSGFFHTLGGWGDTFRQKQSYDSIF